MTQVMMTANEFSALHSDMRKMYECMKRIAKLAEKYPDFTRRRPTSSVPSLSP